MKINLSKKNYVISAGADGLGFAIANKIINSGGKVHLSDLNKSKIEIYIIFMQILCCH